MTPNPIGSNRLKQGCMANHILFSSILSFFWIVSLSFLLSQASHAYVISTTSSGEEAYWYTRCLPLWLNSRGSQTLNQAQLEIDLITSLRAWDEVSCTDLSFIFQGQVDSDFVGYDTNTNAENHNLITFVSQPGQWLYDPNALALTTVTMCVNDTVECPIGTIIDADIEINEIGHRFTTSENSEAQIDFANALTHELGHLIGLDHSSIIEATMYFQQPIGETSKRSLARDDQEAVCALFPVNDERSCDLNAYSFISQINHNDETSMSTQSADEGCSQSIHSHSSAYFLFHFFFFVLSLITLRFRGKQH